MASAVRWILLLLLIGLVIAVIVAFISLANNAGEGIDANEVVQQEINEQIDRLEQFIEENIDTSSQ
jgi:sensor domain CHASE-containing protein